MGTPKKNLHLELQSLANVHTRLEKFYLEGIDEIEKDVNLITGDYKEPLSEQVWEHLSKLKELVYIALNQTQTKAKQLQKEINIADNLEENKRLLLAKYPNKYKTLEDVELY